MRREIEVNEERDVDRYHCGHCQHYHSCQRVDHKAVKFAKPWFKCYDRNQHNGIICCEFHPAERCVHACKTWTGFWDYWKDYVRTWIPYGNTDTLFYFTLGDDDSVRYGVPLMKWVLGGFIEGDTLMAVEKMYYKRDKNPKGFGYRLVREKINGVKIRGLDDDISQ